MQLSPDTLELLKNFSEVNQAIYLVEGSKLSTISSQETLAAFAEIGETLPCDFGLYDLKQFLNIYGMYNSPNVEFNSKYLLITESNGKNKVKIFTAAPEVITHPAQDTEEKFNRAIKTDKNAIKFTLSSDNLAKILKASGIISATHLSLESDGDLVNLVLYSNIKNSESTQFSLEVAEGNGDTYQLFLNTDKLRFLKGAYDVEFSPKGISAFRHTALKLDYFAALEDNSHFKKA